jgi:hypothetical protein
VIEERSVFVAVCDACGHKDYAEDDNTFESNGFTLTIESHATDTEHNAYACKETHIGKAARAVMDKWRTENWDDPLGHMAPAGGMPPDAPPLPTNEDDSDGHGGNL